MFDYLVAENLDKLRSDFEDMNIDPHPKSADMMFIKELIYGGILPNEQVLQACTCIILTIIIIACYLQLFFFIT